MATSTNSKKAIPPPTSGAPDVRRLAERLKQVSDPIRFRVLLLLGDGEQSVGALRSEIACSMTVLSRHLALLRLAGLIVPRRDAQRNLYTLTDAGRNLRRVIEGVADRDGSNGHPQRPGGEDPPARARTRGTRDQGPGTSRGKSQ